MLGSRVKNLLIQKLVKAWQDEAAFDEGANASCNEHGGCFELGAFVCLHMPLTVFSGFQFTDQFLKMKLRCKGFDLLLQLVNQLLSRAKWNARNVVDGFVGVKFYALPTHLGQSIHHVAADVLKP